LSYSDDSSNTFSSPRTINLSQSWPSTADLGDSRRRQFKLTLPLDWNARIDGLEIYALPNE
jgi:hypothetical protein